MRVYIAGPYTKGDVAMIALAKSKGIPVYEGLEDFIYRSTRSA